MNAVSVAALPAVTGGTGEQVTFWICATLAVIGALGMLLSRKAVHSALFVAMTMVNLAVLYITLSATFLGMVQVIVYTGAVMMLFLFVLMIVGVDSSDSLVETIRGQRVAAVLAGLAFGILLVAVVGTASLPEPQGLDAANAAYGGNLQGLAALIFGRYVLAFEVTSALLITAAIGAMILAHRERYEPKVTQQEMSRRRFRGDGIKAPLPSPGVYATHNAVDIPAMLPDGTLSDLSVPKPLQTRGAARSPSAVAEREVAQLDSGEVGVADDVTPAPEESR